MTTTIAVTRSIDAGVSGGWDADVVVVVVVVVETSITETVLSKKLVT